MEQDIRVWKWPWIITIWLFHCFVESFKKKMLCTKSKYVIKCIKNGYVVIKSYDKYKQETQETNIEKKLKKSYLYSHLVKSISHV